MKFAFIIMGEFNVEEDIAKIHNGTAQIIGVSNINEACNEAKRLCAEGIDCIELCGAFGEKAAKEVIDATDNKIPIGFVTHLPEQDEIYLKTFNKNA